MAYPKDLPADILEAAADIAAEYDLPPDWINTEVSSVQRPQEESFSENVYEGKRFNVYVPDKETLLAMKICAGRDKDIGDTIRLAKETGINTRDDMETLLGRYYTTAVVTSVKALNRKFVDRVLRWV